MAFLTKSTKIIPIEEWFNITKARLYKFSISDQIYKKTRLIDTLPYSQPLPEPEEPQHYVSGNVVEQNTPVSRKIYLHRRDTGELVGSVVSGEVTGYFYATTTYSGSHYVICLDDEAGLDYNDLVYGRIYPATISG